MTFFLLLKNDYWQVNEFNWLKLEFSPLNFRKNSLNHHKMHYFILTIFFDYPFVFFLLNEYSALWNILSVCEFQPIHLYFIIWKI